MFVLGLDVNKTVIIFKSNLQKQHMTGSSKSFSVITEYCTDVIFHKIRRGAFHTSTSLELQQQQRTLAFLQGKYVTKNKATFLKSTLPYHLESKTHIYQASQSWEFSFSIS